MGTIVAFALKFDPKNPPFKGWLLCDGSPVPSHYQELKNMLPNGVTPNLCGRTLIGTGILDTSGIQSDGRSTLNFPPSNPPINELPLGYTGGEYVHGLLEVEMPRHSHTINDGNFGHLGIGIETENGGYIPYCMGNNFGPKGTDSAGSNYAHNNMQPYYTINYIIYTGRNS